MLLLRKSWPAAQSLPRLDQGEVQVWHLDLSSPLARELLECAWENLTHHERARAHGIRRERAQDDFVIGRGALRLLLEAATGLAAAEIPLATGEYGKPFAAVAGAPHFNVSHSNGMVLIALSRAGAVGVDVEWLDPSVEVDGLAHSVLHAEERKELDLTADPALLIASFYRIWTQKEALGKACGLGLNLSLPSLNTAAKQAEDHVLGSAAERFQVRSLRVVPSATGKEFAAAIALSSPLREVQALRWPGLDSKPF